VAQILVRDLEPDVVAELKSRAARNRRSLESEVRVILESAVRPETTPFDVVVQHMDDMRERTRGRQTTDSTDLVREDRDR